MVGASHFSMMDFKSGFWQVCMAPGSQQYTAFDMGNLGFYDFTHMLFGLYNGPVTFQRLMQNTLGELNLTYSVIYLDDVIIFGQMKEEHLKRLHVVLERFCKFNLKLKPSKCLFFQNNSISCAPCLQGRYTPQPGQCLGCGGLSHAQHLHAGPHILQTCKALSVLHQGVCQHHPAAV